MIGEDNMSITACFRICRRDKIEPTIITMKHEEDHY